jgi:hypothetical protein
MNRGYAGFYNKKYLRSSYEYAYAKYLDFYNIKWEYEQRTFDVGFKIYKPDFFVYKENGELDLIVEIKSRDKKAIESAQKTLEALKQKYNIEHNIVSYRELLELYQSLPFTLNATINEWNNSANTTISKVSKGKLNPHFNQKHNSVTKKKIGEQSKLLWSSDSEAKKRMVEGLRKTGLAQKGKIKTPREHRSCTTCGNEFKTLITSTQRFCTQVCAGQDNIKSATDHYIKKRQLTHGFIKAHIIEWCNKNKEVVRSTPYNKIKSSLEPLWDGIELKFDVKDFRVISKAVFGEDRGRKELLNFMKDTIN